MLDILSAIFSHFGNYVLEKVVKHTKRHKKLKNSGMVYGLSNGMV